MSSFQPLEGRRHQVEEIHIINQSINQTGGSTNGDQPLPRMAIVPIQNLSSPFMFGCSLNPSSPMFAELQEMLIDEQVVYEKAMRGIEDDEDSDNYSPEPLDSPASPPPTTVPIESSDPPEAAVSEKPGSEPDEVDSCQTPGEATGKRGIQCAVS